MPDGQIIRLQRRVIRLEDESAERIKDAFDRARRELVDLLMERYQRLGSDPDAAAVRELARDVGLIRTIEQRLEELGQQNGLVIRESLSESQQLGLRVADRELEKLAARLSINVSPFTGIDPQLPAMVEAIMKQVDSLSERYRINLTNELMTSLIRGDDFRTIIQRLLAAEPGPEGVSLTRRTKNEADLLARKVVIEANNASRQLIYEEARSSIEDLKKQAMAVIQPDRTTQTCLKVHGQIQEIDQPYILTGKPRFARKIMYPPFHWRCRTSSVAYHPQFEETSKLTTEDMREAAKEELERRKKES
jgi:hypothetical protein